MLRFALRRLYVAVFGLMLLTLPLFALMRVAPNPRAVCGGPTVHCDRPIPAVLPEHKPWSHFIWQTGLPPNDYWPLAIAMLAAEGGAQMLLARRRAETI
jgi:hypothetical protein